MSCEHEFGNHAHQPPCHICDPPSTGQWATEKRTCLACPESAPEPNAEHAVHDAITRALAEAGIKQEVLVGMCIEVGLEAYRDALNRE